MCCFFACHIVSIDILSKKHDPIILTIIQFAVAGILSVFIATIIGEPMNNLNKEVILSILYLSIVSTIVAFGIQNVAQKYTSSTHTAIILSMESVFGSIFAILFLNEILSLKFIIGSVLVIVAVIIAETRLDFIFKKDNQEKVLE